MSKLLWMPLLLAVAACQSGGGWFAVAPAEEKAPIEEPEKLTPAQGLSGLYAHTFRSKKADGKGKLQNEFGRFSYAFEETSPSAAAVRYEGEATHASKSIYGGTDGAWIRVSGTAVLRQGVWVLNTTTGGNCEVRFQADGQHLRHLSAICQQPGRFGHYAWPQAQTVIKFVRALQPREQAELRAPRKPR